MPIQKYNRLGETKSPYLLQHKENPVHWFPWGEEAFEAARTENKPIFLSIGYSTCYWCHMMEKDSFEHQEVADLLNRHFISIKVDREEHPDVDQIYMDAVVGMTGHGGWPMSVFLTPNLKPFFGGTFFWKSQFLSLLTQIHQTWSQEPEKVFASVEQVFQFLQERNTPASEGNLSEDLLRQAFKQLSQAFDSVHGGFGPVPKFPHSMDISLLLRIYRRSGEKKALHMATHSLDQMARGKIYDRIGGGFHRYATREDWNEPHYEKMLYDNALLAWTYLEAYQVTQDKTYAEVSRQTLDYVLREMTHPDGGFYSAQDAGEVGKEGEYYHLNKEERAKHTPLRKDDKILTSWNGLMIAAMAKGYQVLGEGGYLHAAQKGVLFLQKNLFQKGKLLRRFREGEARFDGTLDDYAFLIHGLLCLYESDFDRNWIAWAKELQARQDELFWDNTTGGYFFSPPSDSSLILRKKDFRDAALPAGNSISALNLLRLFLLTYQKSYHDRATELLQRIAGEIAPYPVGSSQALIAMDFYFDRAKEIVIATAPDEKAPSLLPILFKTFLPNKVIAMGPPAGLGDPETLPLLQGKGLKEGKTTFYICENQTCREPTNDVKKAETLVSTFEKLKL